MTAKQSVSDRLIRLLGGTDPNGEVGYIYCVAHPSVPNRYKIGKTGGCVNQRISVLNTSEVHNFTRCWDLLVRDYHATELAVHTALADWRASDRKEFFDLPAAAVHPLRDLLEEHVGVDIRHYIDIATAWMRDA